MTSAKTPCRGLALAEVIYRERKSGFPSRDDATTAESAAGPRHADADAALERCGDAPHVAHLRKTDAIEEGQPEHLAPGRGAAAASGGATRSGAGAISGAISGSGQWLGSGSGSARRLARVAALAALAA
eukprot:COSAG04_NODE_7866_length_1054_cov_19.225131_2_plen_128_part_01